MKRILIFCLMIFASGCRDSGYIEKLSDPQEKQATVAANPVSEKPKITPELSSLSDSDIQVLSRDALVRFAETHTLICKSRLTAYNDVSFYNDSEINPGTLGPNTDYIDRKDFPYATSVREAFGDYDSLPESVRKIVLNEGASDPEGEEHQRRLSLKTIMWSKEQRKAQIILEHTEMPSMSFTFLYKVDDDGTLRFIRSLAMGCSSPEGRFIKETSE